MKKIPAFFRSLGTFIGTLVGRKDLVLSYSPNGYPLLSGWNYSPEDEAVQAAHAWQNRPARKPRAALYCYEGNHRGEVFFLKQEMETVGPTLASSVVLTPKITEFPEGQSYKFFVDKEVHLVSSPGGSFRVNGTEQRESNLYDFDQVEIFRNRFLFLSFESSGETWNA